MKRSLLTILMDLAPPDIRTAAEVWEIPLTKRTHADNVALLYQAMTDRWVLDDLLDGLPQAARDLLGVLALGHDDGVTREELMTRLSFDPLDLNAALATLRWAAIVHRQSTGTLYLPRELATLISRAIRERQRGDTATPTINQVLDTLDADVLLDAARRWHIADAPASLRPGDRERLLHAVKQRVKEPRALVEVEAALSPGARRVVLALREEGTPLPLDEAAALAGTQTPIARRALLAELTASLVAYHTWVWGERVLVMPTDFRNPAMTQLPLPPLNAVSAEARQDWRHPFALAWDVLTFLRLADNPLTRWPSGGLVALVEDHAFAEHVAPQFWATGETDVPPGAVLAFYGALARGRGLLTEHAESGRHLFAVNDPVAWAKLSFAAQTRELFATWRRVSGWIEGQRTAVQLWGVDWPTFRERLLEALTACQPGHWYLLENLLNRLALNRPSLLGDGFTAASGIGQNLPDRDALVRACAEATLRTALTWFGVVAWGRVGNEDAVQLTDLGWWLLGRGREPILPPFGATPLSIQTDLTIHVLNAEPTHLWSLLALADVETLDRISSYRITAASLRRALRRGLAFEQVIRFLESRSGGPLPEAMRVTLDDWVRAVRRVVLDHAIVLSADDSDVRDEAVALARSHGATIQSLPDGRVLIHHADADEFGTWLKDAGLTTVWRALRQ